MPFYLENVYQDGGGSGEGGHFVDLVRWGAGCVLLTKSLEEWGRGNEGGNKVGEMMGGGGGGGNKGGNARGRGTEHKS